MNMVLLFANEFSGPGICELDGARARACLERHALKLHDTRCAGILGAEIGTLSVQELEQGLEKERLRLIFTPRAAPPPRLPVKLLVAVTRPQTVKKVVHAAVTLGIEELHFFRADKGEKSYLQSRILEEQALQEQIHLGLEQAVDTCSPKLELHRNHDQFFHETLEHLVSSQSPEYQRWIADGSSLGGDSPKPPAQGVFLAIGPEAGWSAREQRTFAQMNFFPLSLGPRMLRVEIACVLGLGYAAQAIGMPMRPAS